MSGTKYTCATCGKLDADCKCLATTIRLLRAERDYARRRGDDLCALLTELYALVRGECPRLLDEDSGGDAVLALAIEQALREPQQ